MKECVTHHVCDCIDRHRVELGNEVQSLRAELKAEKERGDKLREALRHCAPTQPFGESHSMVCPCRRPEETMAGPKDCICVSRLALARPDGERKPNE